MPSDYRTLFDGLQVAQTRDTLAGVSDLNACEREVIRLMREATKRKHGRATFIVEFIGNAWHVLETLPPKHVKL